MIYPIVTEPNPVLRKKAETVRADEIGSEKFQTLIDDMIETMYAASGIGIAAPQIGLSRRIIIAETGEHKPVAFINPEITSKSWGTVTSEEGCLSVPGLYGIVKRHKSVSAKALGRDGKPVLIKNKELLAIILQHEIDHLNGILFVDKAKHIHPISEYRNPKI